MFPMSYSSTGTSFSHNNGIEGEVMDSRPTGCVCNLPIKKNLYFQCNLFGFVFIFMFCFFYFWRMKGFDSEVNEVLI